MAFSKAQLKYVEDQLDVALREASADHLRKLTDGLPPRLESPLIWTYGNKMTLTERLAALSKQCKPLSKLYTKWVETQKKKDAVQRTLDSLCEQIVDIQESMGKAVQAHNVPIDKKWADAHTKQAQWIKNAKAEASKLLLSLALDDKVDSAGAVQAFVDKLASGR